MKKIEFLSWGIILVSYMLAITLYSAMPEKMATHWNAGGEANGYMPKLFALFFAPSLSLLMFGLFFLLPKIDPLKANIEKFRKYYDGFIACMLLFLLYIFILTLAWNLGIKFNMTRMILPAMGFLFYYLGILLENARRNWFIGIRTPWTLSSEKVWDKTHKIGAKLYKAAGLLALAGVFFEKYALLLVLPPIIMVSAYLVVYSYLEYRKEKQNDLSRES